MPTIGSASLLIEPSFKGIQSKIEGGTGKALTAAGSKGGEKFGDAAGKTMSSKFTGYAKTAAKAGALALAGVGAAVVKIGIDSVKAASDLSESTNKVQQVFGKGAEQVFRFAEKAADKFGQTNQQARDAAATFGIFGRVAKLSGRENAKFAITMDKLASDLASFHNTSPEQAIEAIGAAMRGEAEPIRAYGVLLDEATLKAEALSMGLLKPVKDQAKIKGYQVAILEGQKKYNEAVKENGKESLEALKAEANLGTARDRLKKATEGTIPPLTQQQKVLAAQSAILKQTKVAQGDFARTSDGLANAQRRLTARWEDAKAKLGTALLPTVNKFVKYLLDKGIPAVEQFADWFNRDGIKRIGEFGDKLGTVAGHVKDVAGFLKDLPSSAKLAGLLALGGGITAAKIRGGNAGGGGGVLGSIGRATGLAKPIPVFVTNMGAGVGGGLLPGGPASGGPAGTTGKVSKLAKVGSFAAKAYLPIAAITTSALALKDLFNWNHQGDSKADFMSGGKIGDWVRGIANAGDEASDTKARLDNVQNAADKVERQLGDTKNAGQKLADVLFTIDKSDPKVNFTAPGFNALFYDAQQYKSLLDGLPRRVETHFVQTVTRNNVLEETGGTGGKTPRVAINIGRVEAHDYNDFMYQVQNRARRNSLDGVR